MPGQNRRVIRKHQQLLAYAAQQEISIPARQ
ncbi:MAG: hypothetical protein RIQ71_2723, partial [Verrucomicrobiota bacterium]